MSRDINIVETKDAMAEPQLHEIGFKTDVPPKQELREFPFWSAVAAEFWGMLLFIWITLTTIAGSAASDAAVVTIAAAFGFTIFAIVYTFAGVSGGNFNPAITAALLFTKKISPVRAVCYIIAQMVGSLCGAALAKAISFERFDDVDGGANIITTGVSRQSALLAEIIATSLVTLVVLAAVDNVVQGPRVPHIAIHAPFAIGMSIFVAHLAMIPIDGCSINPARSFGPAVVASEWDYHWVFWVGPLVGGVLGGWVYETICKVK